ncbi:MAG: hypothetical protein V1867_07905 [Candidatus Falkowbacteria bacterium]
MKKNKFFSLVIFVSAVLFGLFSYLYPSGGVRAEISLAERLSGRILLRVEGAGEAWYVNPGDQKRYFLSRPLDCFNIMHGAGVGITDNDLNKFPVGLTAYGGANDADKDGLSDEIETALKTDPGKTDTDNDGYSDKEEVSNNFDPLGNGPQIIDLAFAALHKGKIFLQTEGAGEAWYIDPQSLKRYYLGRPADAFAVMRTLGLGITDKNLNTIAIGEKLEAPNTQTTPPPPQIIDSPANTAAAAMAGASAAFIDNNPDKAKIFFNRDVHKALEYTFEYQEKSSLMAIAGLLDDAALVSQTENTAVYSIDVYFDLGGRDGKITFYVDKEDDGHWYLRSL